MNDVDFLVCGTQGAWIHKFAASALGIDPERTITLYPQIGNIGAAMIPVNLHTAASRGLIKPGDLVMLYNFGGVSTAAAAVVRWGKTALGPPMEPPERLL
jgi:3-oxoacyl-[acyl-carrier-protein] synthase-3